MADAEGGEGGPMPAKPPSTGGELTDFNQWMAPQPVPDATAADRHVVQ